MSLFDVKMDREAEKVFSDIKLNATGTRRALRQAWFEVGRHLKSNTNKEILRRPKGGRTYFVRSRSSGKRRRHVASAPGETHANQFGDLRKTLGWKIRGDQGGEFGYGPAPIKVPGSSSDLLPLPAYAGAIEFGRLDGSIEARPSILHGIEASARDIEVTLADHIDRELNG